MTQKFNIEPTNGLFEKIHSQIQKEERSFCIKRIALFSFILCVCALSFAPSLKMLISDFNRSGFLNFSSLLLSDFSVVAVYWQNFMMALVESLPTLSLALFLSILLGILQSLKYLTKDIKTILKTAS